MAKLPFSGKYGLIGHKGRAILVIAKKDKRKSPRAVLMTLAGLWTRELKLSRTWCVQS